MDDDFVDPNEHYGDDQHVAPNSSSLGVESVGLHRTIGYIAAAICLIAFAYFYNQDWFGSEKPSQDTTPSLSMLADEKPGPVGLVANKVEELTGLSVPGSESLDWAKQEEIAANRSAVTDFRSKLETISSLANANSEALVLLQSKVGELRTSEAGAKIASNFEYVQQYIALENEISKLKTSSSTVADNFVKDMKALLKRVDDAQDTSYAPQAFVVDRADSFLADRKEKAVELKRFDEAITNLVGKSQELTPGTILETALREQGQIEENDLAETLAAARRDALKNSKLKLADAEKERINSETEVRLAEKRAETSNNKTLAKEISDKLAADKEAKLKALAKQKLEREFTQASGEIQTYLCYLTADGRSNRGSATGSGPVSLSIVRSSGALDSGDSGIIAMSRWCGSTGVFNNQNSRANKSNVAILGHSMLSNSFYEPSIKYAEKAQQLLKKFGPLMVEKGLLAE